MWYVYRCHLRRVESATALVEPTHDLVVPDLLPFWVSPLTTVPSLSCNVTPFRGHMLETALSMFAPIVLHPHFKRNPGGERSFDLYDLGAISETTPSPIVTADDLSPPSFDYVGCFKDDGSYGALVPEFRNNKMTPEVCP